MCVFKVILSNCVLDHTSCDRILDQKMSMHTPYSFILFQALHHEGNELQEKDRERKTSKPCSFLFLSKKAK